MSGSRFVTPSKSPQPVTDHDTFKKPTRLCGWCGRRYTATKIRTGDHCRDCMPLAKMPLVTDDSSVALTGGSFRLDPVRRIQVWVPDVA